MDKDIIQLVKILKKKDRDDLAYLLIGSKSIIEQTDQYGSYWNQFLSTFIVLVPAESYVKLEKLSDSDKKLLHSTVLEIYPKSYDLEIGFLTFKLLQNHDEIKGNKRLATSWLIRASNKLEEGKKLVSEYKYAEAISSFQECIELSLKSIFLLLTNQHPKTHKFDEKEFQKMISNIPESIENLEFHKLYLYSIFWERFYTISKYGLENFRIGPDKLYEKEEAELALKHAGKCLFAANQLESYLIDPW